uniref:Uncharacterized protein n=1 Tax=Chelydra serpentina TaxID=8475 RepID=A0A8C3S4I8_CHESE
MKNQAAFHFYGKQVHFESHSHITWQIKLCWLLFSVSQIHDTLVDQTQCHIVAPAQQQKHRGHEKVFCLIHATFSHVRDSPWDNKADTYKISLLN